MPTEKIVAPYPLAMILCDAVWHDPSTGKRTLLGLFSSISARSYPMIHPFSAVHVALTDGRGQMDIRLRLIEANESHGVLWEGIYSVHFIDPRATWELDFHVHNVKFPAPGEYRFQLFAANQYLMERRLYLFHVLEQLA